MGIVLEYYRIGMVIVWALFGNDIEIVCGLYGDFRAIVYNLCWNCIGIVCGIEYGNVGYSFLDCVGVA